MRYYKFWFLLLSLVMFFSVGNAIWITFQLNPWTTDSTSNPFAHIHFGVGGNDFGGVFVWGGADDSIEEETIETTTEKVVCTRKVKGLYYNSQRGERLRPLDEATFSELGFTTQGLAMTWGLFTSCASGTVNGQTGGDSYGLYGMVIHTFKKNDYVLLAGVKYNTGNVNTILSNSPLAPTFQRFDNKYPLGLLYDYNGGIGFIGCKFTNETGVDRVIEALNETGVNNFFVFDENGKPVPMQGYENTLDCSKAEMSLDQLLLFKIQWIIGMSSDVSEDLANIAGEQANDSKTQYFSTVNVNNATLVNQAKRKAEELCRGKWRTESQGVICKQGDYSPEISEIEGKTLIVQNGNLTLNGSGTTAALDIFVDKGILILPWEGRTNFDEKGYPSSTPSVSSGVFYKGNFIINGLVKVSKPEEKYYIHGKFTSLNTYAVPNPSRVTQVQNLLWNDIEKDDIDLTKIFQWRCSYTGSASDGSLCVSGEFRNAPLVIINQNYPSKLLQ